MFLDDVQYCKGDYQNRNRILLPDGSIDWLTLPVSCSSKALIKDVLIAGTPGCFRSQFNRIRGAYGKHPGFFLLEKDLLKFYEDAEKNVTFLADLNIIITLASMQLLEVQCPAIRSSSIPNKSEDPTQRLIDICRHVGADTYVAGEGSKNYMDLSAFQHAGISVEYSRVTENPYLQLNNSSGTFIKDLSVLDLFCNMGRNSFRYV